MQTTRQQPVLPQSESSARELCGESTATARESVATICRLFKSGTTMPELAEQYKCSRQRIQQLIKKEGLTGKDGGLSVKKTKLMEGRFWVFEDWHKGVSVAEIVRRSTKTTDPLTPHEVKLALRWHSAQPAVKNECLSPLRTRKISETWGCTSAEWKSLRAMHADYGCTPIGRYAQFKSNAKRLYPGAKWDISLLQWWNLWKASGHYKHIGTERKSYCMTRIDGTGAFAPGNLRVLPVPKMLAERNGQKVIKRKKKTAARSHS